MWARPHAILSALVGTEPASWSVIGTGDFNGDGTSDILLRDTNGDVGIWFMQNGAFASAAGVGNAPVAYSVQDTGDFNGDGKSDLFWYNPTTLNTAIWYMNGATATVVNAVSESNSYPFQGLNAD
jgi:hypothetical protein